MAMPIGLVSCQKLINGLVPGEQPEDGDARLLQAQQDSAGGSGTLASPAAIFVRAKGGTHLAVRVDGGVAWQLDQQPAEGRSSLCLLLPSGSNEGWGQAQFLVASARQGYDVLIGLARFEEEAVEPTVPGAGGAEPTPVTPTPVAPEPQRELLEHACPGAALVDQVTVHVRTEEVLPPTPTEGGAGGRDPSDGGAAGAAMGIGGAGSNGDAGGAAPEPPVAEGGASGSPTAGSGGEGGGE
ncbi:MAG: hypothetical protein K0R38_2943 [Polyangiaceae bacterium]|jgi:hypothetical protein|nr:hypothetical protein [Polyangiaceae bacterium]